MLRVIHLILRFKIESINSCVQKIEYQFVPKMMDTLTSEWVWNLF